MSGPISSYSEELSGLLSQLAEMLCLDSSARTFIFEQALISALGTALGYRQVSAEMAATTLEIYEQIQWENHVALCAAWPPPPALRDAAMFRAGRWVPMFRDDADYAEYLARHAATGPLAPIPRKREWWLEAAWAYLLRHSRGSAFHYDNECERARKVVGPALSSGVTRDALRATLCQACPILQISDIEILLNEEAAWWVRWRYDHVPKSRQIEPALELAK